MLRKGGVRAEVRRRRRRNMLGGSSASEVGVAGRAPRQQLYSPEKAVFAQNDRQEIRRRRQDEARGSELHEGVGGSAGGRAGWRAGNLFFLLTPLVGPPLVV